MLADSFYSSPAWREARDRVLARDRRRCVVARLLGGACEGVLHVHHLQRPNSALDRRALDEDNLASVCAHHHPQWEAVRRAVVERRHGRPVRCPHKHVHAEARRQCEERLARDLA